MGWECPGLTVAARAHRSEPPRALQAQLRLLGATQSPRARGIPGAPQARPAGSPAGSWLEPTTLQTSLGTAADMKPKPLSWIPPASAGQAPHPRCPPGRGTRAKAHRRGSAALQDGGKDPPVKGRRWGAGPGAAAAHPEPILNGWDVLGPPGPDAARQLLCPPSPSPWPRGGVELFWGVSAEPACLAHAELVG